MSDVSSSTLAHSTADRLRREIFEGRLLPGTRLAEAAEAKRLGVSRVPVREAFAALEREGLVTFTPTGRTEVRRLTTQDFEELYEMRLLFEPAAARAAFPLSRAQFRALERNIELTRKAESLDEVTRLDLDFHELILVFSGNSRLLKLWRSLRSELELWLGDLHRQHSGQELDTREQTACSHEDLVETFRTGSAAAAERTMHDHILGWREWLPMSEEEDFPV